MATCSNCGADTPRLRTVFLGKETRDECPQCAPGSFEKFTAPSDKKIAMGFEAHPNEYEKRYDEDGVFYIRKPEYRAEQEQRLTQPAEDDRLREEQAVAEKRATRRTQPLSPDEVLFAINKARDIADAIAQSNAEAQKQAEEAELQSWIQKAAQA
jgi:hypothetical protein